MRRPVIWRPVILNHNKKVLKSGKLEGNEYQILFYFFLSILWQILKNNDTFAMSSIQNILYHKEEISISNVLISICSHLMMYVWNSPTEMFNKHMIYFSSVQSSFSVMSNSLWPHGLQHARLPCPPPTPAAYSNSSPLHRLCHRTISFCWPILPPSIFRSIRVFSNE